VNCLGRRFHIVWFRSGHGIRRRSIRGGWKQSCIRGGWRGRRETAQISRVSSTAPIATVRSRGARAGHFWTERRCFRGSSRQRPRAGGCAVLNLQRATRHRGGQERTVLVLCSDTAATNSSSMLETSGAFMTVQVL
jgi:hypothetical protein